MTTTLSILKVYAFPFSLLVFLIELSPHAAHNTIIRCILIIADELCITLYLIKLDLGVLTAHKDFILFKVKRKKQASVATCGVHAFSRELKNQTERISNVGCSMGFKHI